MMKKLYEEVITHHKECFKVQENSIFSVGALHPVRNDDRINTMGYIKASEVQMGDIINTHSQSGIVVKIIKYSDGVYIRCTPVIPKIGVKFSTEYPISLVARPEISNMNTHQNIFGFPKDLTTVDIGGSDQLIRYGLAYYSGNIERWSYYVGSFPYLYGIYMGLSRMDDDMILNREVPVAFTFLLLDQEHNPIRLIGQFCLD